MGEKELSSDPLPESVRRALLSSPTILRKLCRLGGYEDVEISVDELLRESPVFSEKPSADVEKPGVKLLSERIGSRTGSYLIEANLQGKRISTLLNREEEKRGDLTIRSLVLTQEYETKTKDGVSRLEILTSEKRNSRRVDVLFGTESTPSFFHAKFEENGRLAWCSFIGSPPVERVFSKPGVSILEEKEFMCFVPDWQRNLLHIGIYLDTGIRTRRPVSRDGLRDYTTVPMSQETGSEIVLNDHSLYTSLESDRLLIHHTNERSHEEHSPHFVAGISRQLSPTDVDSLFLSDGSVLVDACRNLPLYFSFPPLWMEMDLKRTLY